MTDTVAVTLPEALWWLLGTLAMAGLAMCLHELYWLLIETAYAIRHRLTRRPDA